MGGVVTDNILKTASKLAPQASEWWRTVLQEGRLDLSVH